MDSNDLKRHLLSKMSDDELAKTLVNMKLMIGIISQNDWNKIIGEICLRVNTSNKILIETQDLVIDRFNKLYNIN